MRFYTVVQPFNMGDDNPGGNYYGERWSYHLARPPGILGDAEPEVIRWFHDNIYDRPELDPNQQLANVIDAYKREANRLGIRVDETDWLNAENYARLQLGTTSWAHIAGEGGSAAPQGPNALSAPLLDVIHQVQEAAIAPLRAAEIAHGDYLGDDVRLLASTGLNNAVVGAQIANTPQAAIALSPEPARYEAPLQAAGQTGYTGTGGFSTQSAFNGFGTSGSMPSVGLPTAAGGAGAMAASSGKGLIVIGVLIAAYFLLRKGFK